MNQSVRAVKEENVMIFSTLPLTSHFCTSAGKASFHGNAQVISLHYIFFLLCLRAVFHLEG